MTKVHKFKFGDNVRLKADELSLFTDFFDGAIGVIIDIPRAHTGYNLYAVQFPHGVVVHYHVDYMELVKPRGADVK